MKRHYNFAITEIINIHFCILSLVFEEKSQEWCPIKEKYFKI